MQVSPSDLDGLAALASMRSAVERVTNPSSRLPPSQPQGMYMVMPSPSPSPAACYPIYTKQAPPPRPPTAAEGRQTGEGGASREWQPGMSKYLGVVRGTGANARFWYATAQRGTRHRFSSRFDSLIKAENYLLQKFHILGIDPATKLRPGYPGDESPYINTSHA